MSIQTELDRLQTAKADLKTAIEGKGVTVPDTTTLDGYGTLVGKIQTGGGGGGDLPSGNVYFPDLLTPYAPIYILCRDGTSRVLYARTNYINNETVPNVSFLCLQMNDGGTTGYQISGEYVVQAAVEGGAAGIVYQITGDCVFSKKNVGGAN